MRLFIYQAHEDVPFEGLFQPLGSYKKVILSNHIEQIELFKQLKGAPIQELLPEGIPDASDANLCYISSDDDRIFFVPLEMKDTFMNLLNRLFQTTWWKQDQTTPKPSQDEMGVVGGDELSQFYVNLETQAVLKPITEDTVDKTQAKEELLQLFNEIAAQDNEIDAVLVSTYDGNRTRVAYSSDSKGDRKVDTDAYATQLKDLVSLLTKTQQVNPNIGLFDHLMFQYNANANSSGGIIHVSHLPNHGEYTFLIFVSATAEGIEMLELYRNRNLDKIKELLDVLLGG